MSNDELIRRLVRTWNLRLLVTRLADALDQLSKHGPSKPEDERGLDEKTVALSKKVEADTRAIASGEKAADPGAATGGAADGGSSEDSVARPAHFNPDPLEQRTGAAPEPRLQVVLEKVATDAREAVSKRAVDRKEALSPEALEEHVRLMGGAVTMAFPAGLPEHDPIRGMLEAAEKRADKLHEEMGPEYLDPESATLWWAGKEFRRDQNVGDRTGRNEKTKIVARLQGKGGGPPAREPGVSEAERRAMMAHYFKRQEELKGLAEDDEDGFMSSKWADSSSLKSSLTGVGSIKFR